MASSLDDRSLPGLSIVLAPLGILLVAFGFWSWTPLPWMSSLMLSASIGQIRLVGSRRGCDAWSWTDI